MVALNDDSVNVLAPAADINVKIMSNTVGHSDTCVTPDTHQSVPPQVGKNAAEATTAFLPCDASCPERRKRPVLHRPKASALPLRLLTASDAARCGLTGRAEAVAT
ncbi:hypothetical protein [Streptomyces sp. HUAS TT20]|uniref:hypothetical protein n=1 Tax=Streptomyces sp. HUAS TT20 TaxID=3447509 RepID=UPI0021D82342|nr:hypothetical protein [Streptomyces sp. HUAS 15-9]UXY28975.1 hypothetical protein N8I87_22080 [Streptomyces sp. HUAS 15-9]